MESTYFLRVLYAVVVIFLSLFVFFRLRYRQKVSLEKQIPTAVFHPVIGFLLWLMALNSNPIPVACGVFMRVNATCLLFAKHGFYMVDLTLRRLMVVYNADIMQFLYNHPDSQEKAWEYAKLKSVLGSSLLITTMEKAHKRRKVITPAFHLRVFKDYMDVFNERSMKLINEIKQQPERWIDLEHCMRQLTLDIISQTAMGVQLDANKEAKEFFESFEKMKDLCFRRMLQPWMHSDFVYYSSPSGRQLKKYYSNMLQFMERIISESIKQLQSKADNPTVQVDENANEDRVDSMYWKRKSFMQLLLEAHLKDPDDFNLSDVRDEVITFMLEGMDTLATAISLILLMLGLDEAVQERAREEIDSIFQDDPHRLVIYDDLKDMKYLECVIKETLRLFPSAAFIAKEIKSDMLIGDNKIPGGTGILINLYMLHRDPNHFPKPELFDPDRFLPENCARRHPYAYIPFSAGSRNCIGQKFAMSQMKCVTANILRNFQITSRDHRDKLKLSWEISTKLVEPIFSKFTPRRIN